MKQPSLFDTPKPLRALAKYDRENLEAARIILADVERYGGEGSLMVRVSRATLEKVDHAKT